jgi:hypothetical protein
VDWLCDGYFAIRMTTTKVVVKLVLLFGTEWAQQVIIPAALQLHASGNYQHRMILLKLTELLAPIVGTEVCVNTFLPIIIKMSSVFLKKHFLFIIFILRI